jgi:hypothetical protein
LSSYKGSPVGRFWGVVLGVVVCLFGSPVFAAPPVLEVSPTYLEFNGYEGSGNPENQVVSIWKGGGNGPLNWEVAEDCNWIVVEPNSGKSMGEVDNVNVIVDISGLAAGTYNCGLTVDAGTAANSPQTVDVNLIIIGGWGETNTYVIVPYQSSLLQTGGFGGIYETHPVEGEFQLTANLGIGEGSFDWVDAIWGDGWDLGELFHMTELEANDVNLFDTTIRFELLRNDPIFPCADIILDVNFVGDTVHLTGSFCQPAYDGYEFDLDAVAVLKKYGGGLGDANYPYLIYDANQMNAIGADSNDWDKEFRLMADIDLGIYTGTSFNVIGNTTYKFTGVFDGNSHTISNFTYSSNGLIYIGIFGDVGAQGAGTEIKDLGLIDPNIGVGTGGAVGPLAGRVQYTNVLRCYSVGGNVSGQYVVGGLVGENHLGDVSNCRSAVSVSGSDWVGGLVGRNFGTISDSNSASTVDGNDYIGGLVGNSVFFLTHESIYPEVYNCCATGDVNGDDYVGGLVGYAEDGNISSCYAIGSVTGNKRAGGLVGDNDGTILKCYATGSVAGHYEETGGLVGRNGGRILNSHATGSVTGDDWETGGLVGVNRNGTVSNCYSTGSVTGYDGTGGLVGVNREVGTILNCYTTGSVSGQYETGGLVGIHLSGSYTKCFWDSDVNPDVNGIGNTTDPNVIGESTANMQTGSTFTDAGWDFVGEVINGPNDIWDICELTNYPKLAWQIPLPGDFVCPDGVTLVDFSVLGLAWYSDPNQPNWNLICDISEPNDNFIDELDLKVFTENWLAGVQ